MIRIGVFEWCFWRRRAVERPRTPEPMITMGCGIVGDLRLVVVG